MKILLIIIALVATGCGSEGYKEKYGDDAPEQAVSSGRWYTPVTIIITWDNLRKEEEKE